MLSRIDRKMYPWARMVTSALDRLNSIPRDAPGIAKKAAAAVTVYNVVRDLVYRFDQDLVPVKVPRLVAPVLDAALAEMTPITVKETSAWTMELYELDDVHVVRRPRAPRSETVVRTISPACASGLTRTSW